jgi:hypothetical protein
MSKLRWTLAILAVAVTAAVGPTVALADPSGPNVQENWTLACGAETVVINIGTVTNSSHVAFVLGSESIFVVNYFAVTIGSDTFVLIDAAQGLNKQNLVTCTTTVSGEAVVLRGFFTPSA